MLLNQIINDGLNPKKKTADEYASSCPGCGGNDRFIIFAEQNKYWCRQCGTSGDAIQYLRDYHGMTFQEASECVGKTISDNKPSFTLVKRSTTQKPQSPSWKQKAKKAVEYAHDNFLAKKSVLEWLKKERGITEETVRRFRLGWFGHDIYQDRENWGLEKTGKDLYIPSGLVIPWQGKRIRIRRDNPGDFGRYYVVPGSKAEPMVIGNSHETLGVIVESELDAILLAQEADRELFIIALGSAQMKPDERLSEQLEACPVILVALDTDEAGAKSSRWWCENFHNAFRTLVPKRFGKDITDAFLAGINLNEWLDASLEIYCDSLVNSEG